MASSHNSSNESIFASRIDSLDEFQTKSVKEYVERTEQDTLEAIEALRQCGWNLPLAILRFGQRREAGVPTDIKNDSKNQAKRGMGNSIWTEFISSIRGDKSGFTFGAAVAALNPFTKQTKNLKGTAVNMNPALDVRPDRQRDAKNTGHLTATPNIPTGPVSVDALSNVYSPVGRRRLPATNPYANSYTNPFMEDRSEEFRSSLKPIYYRPLAPPASTWNIESLRRVNDNVAGVSIIRHSLRPARPLLLAPSLDSNAAFAVKVFKTTGDVVLRVPPIVITPPSPPKAHPHIASTTAAAVSRGGDTSIVKPTITVKLPVREAVRPPSVRPPSEVDSPPLTPPPNISTAPISSVDRLSPRNMGDVPGNRWGPELRVRPNNLLSPDSARFPTRASRQRGTTTSASTSRASETTRQGSLSPSRRLSLLDITSPNKGEARRIIRRSLGNVHLPRPKENQPLFRPADARRLWYLGFVEHWGNLQIAALEFWKTSHCQEAFDKIDDSPVTPPRGPDPLLSKESHDSEIHKSYFQRDVVEVISNIFNMLQSVKTKPDPPGGIFLAEADEEDMGDQDFTWKPTFVIKARMHNREEEIRLLGHIEYLGGKRGALTQAIKELPHNTWGSLRCVLGDIAQYMLMSSVSHAFIASADEVMFIRLTIKEKCEYGTRDGEPVDTLCEPWLLYSDPIRFEDKLDERNGTISVNLALLYMLNGCTNTAWKISKRLGSSLNYAAKTNAGEAYVPKLHW